jgi:TonB family protein
MSPRRSIRLLSAAALAAVSACAGAPAGSAAPGDGPGWPRRTCHAAREPRELPAAAALLDSAGRVNAAAEAWRHAGRPAGHVVFSLRYDPHGLNVRRQVIEHRVAPALADSLQALAFAHRRTTARADREWGVRLRMELGEQPALKVERSILCPPALRDPVDGPFSSAANRGWGDVRDPLPAPSLGTASAVWLRVALDAGGNVTDVRVERGAVLRDGNAQLLSAVHALDFVPATEDGEPVAGETTIVYRLR